ncbi:hypothetical protein AC578_1367, partial [Pseudocercospora eumusae]
DGISRTSNLLYSIRASHAPNHTQRQNPTRASLFVRYWRRCCCRRNPSITPGPPRACSPLPSPPLRSAASSRFRLASPRLDNTMDVPSDSSGLSSPLSSVPSSPLTEFSSSPSPPPEMRFSSRRSPGPYPSPPASQQTSQSGSPAPDGMDSKNSSDREGRPAKRRRITSEKERTTEYLDLRARTVDAEQQIQLDRLVNVLHKRQKIVVIAGAGISVSAGIPDFRSSQGLFRSLKEEYNLKGSGKHLFDASVYKDDVSTSSFHDMVSTMSRLTKDAKPTAFHHMLATIAQEDRLLRLYSQNVDGIDTSMDPLKTSVPLKKNDANKWPRTVQLHGGLDYMVCSKCHELSDLDPSLFDGPVPPLCSRCEEINDIRTNHEGKRSHGIGRLRPRMVLYNEHNPDDEAIGAVTKDDLRKRPDAVIVVGTTLKVPGVRRIVREMCATVRDRRGGVAIWINSDPPPIAKDLEDCWDIIVQGPCDEVARHAAMRKWDVPAAPEEFSEVSEEDAKKVAAKTMRVQLPKCPIKHAAKEPLPSQLHKNNSFRPPLPDDTPRKPMDFGPLDWSPMGTLRTLIVPSIENSEISDDSIAVVHDDTVPVAVTGLLTPSKSQRSSPVEKLAAKKAAKDPVTNLNDKLKAGAKKQTTTKSASKKGSTAAKKPATGIKAPKKGTSVGRPRKDAKANAKPSPKTSLKNSFASSKAGATALKAGQKDIENAAKSPSKLRDVTNASSEPMVPLSPQDPRNNASPVQTQNVDATLEQADDLNKSRMSIQGICN